MMEVQDIVQEAVIKTIPKKKEMQKGKMVVWEVLTNNWEKWNTNEKRKDISIWMESS